MVDVVEVVVEMTVGVVVVGRYGGTGHVSGGEDVPGFRHVAGETCRKPIRFPAYFMGDVPNTFLVFGVSPGTRAENLEDIGMEPAKFSA